jgi:hypothetical protein
MQYGQAFKPLGSVSEEEGSGSARRKAVWAYCNSSSFAVGLFMAYILYVVASFHRIMNPLDYLPAVDQYTPTIDPLWQEGWPLELECSLRCGPTTRFPTLTLAQPD